MLLLLLSADPRLPRHERRSRDFETKIVVKVNAPEVLRRQLAAKRWKGEGIAMGTNTDPYQRGEGRYRLMPRIIGALTDFRNPFSILTKGTLIRRDIDLLVEASASPTSRPRSRSAPWTRAPGAHRARDAAPARAHRDRRRPQLRGHPVRGADGADPARNHGRPGRARRGGPGRDRGRRHLGLADPAAPSARRARGVPSLARRAPPRPRRALRAHVRGPYASTANRRRWAERSRRSVARSAARGRSPTSAFRALEPAPRRPDDRPPSS